MTVTLALDAAIAVLPAEPAPTSADEINHRIANSLQLLSAMVSIEARGVRDPAAIAALDMTRQRIAAIASVHRQLYRAREAALVDLGAYLEELGGDLERSLADASAGRRLVVRADAVAVAADHASSIGIIVSELVSNACKYAYAPGEPGEIRVLLRAMPFGGYRLEVQDDGIGLAHPASGGTGLGSRLVEMMATRLGGNAGWRDARPGTHFVLCVGKR